jgi:hypothetical protein
MRKCTPRAKPFGAFENHANGLENEPFEGDRTADWHQGRLTNSMTCGKANVGQNDAKASYLWPK